MKARYLAVVPVSLYACVSSGTHEVALTELHPEAAAVEVAGGRDLASGQLVWRAIGEQSGADSQQALELIVDAESGVEDGLAHHVGLGVVQGRL